MTPKILIIVRGGLVQDVYHTVDCDVTIIDHDNMDSGDDVADCYPSGIISSEEMDTLIEEAREEHGIN